MNEKDNNPKKLLFNLKVSFPIKGVAVHQSEPQCEIPQWHMPSILNLLHIVSHFCFHLNEKQPVQTQSKLTHK